MGLFDKKFCDICHNKIGLLGNRKLEDGNLCKDCAAKLSPFFSERRNSTVQEIRSQLESREENKKAVAAFRVSRSFGIKPWVLLDDTAGKFLVCSHKNFQEYNPDVLDLSQVVDAQVKVDERRTEIKYEKDGRQVSYHPARFNYSYNLSADIYLNHPYIENINIPLNELPIKVGQQPVSQLGPGADKTGTVKGQIISNVLGVLANQGTTNIASWNAEYNACYNKGLEIVKALTASRQASPVQPLREQETPAQPLTRQAPVSTLVCPWCGSSTSPNAEGRCPHCDAPLAP